MVMAWRLLVALASLATVSAFVPTLRPKLAPARAVAFAPLTPVVAVPRRQLASVQMGLFGLGWAEIGVIGILALFIFGPERLAPFAKEFGKSASGLKEVAESFKEGMDEGETGVSKDGGEQAIKSAVDPEQKDA